MFPNENKTLSAKDGADITLIQAGTQSNYENNTWTFINNGGPWIFVDGEPFPLLYGYQKPNVVFVDDLSGKDGLTVTITEAKDPQTYIDNTWSGVGFIWFFDPNKNEGFPTFQFYPDDTITAYEVGVVYPYVLLGGEDVTELSIMTPDGIRYVYFSVDESPIKIMTQTGVKNVLVTTLQ